MRLERAFQISLISLIVFGISVIHTSAQNESASKTESTYDEVTINFPNPVKVGQQTLDRGDYKIRLSGNEGEAFKAPNDPKKVEFKVGINQFPFGEPTKETKVILHRSGSDYILNEVWIQGKGYYYKTAERMVEPFRAAVEADGMSDENAVALNATHREISLATSASSAPN
jgi:hypothetical protein